MSIGESGQIEPAVSYVPGILSLALAELKLTVMVH